MTTLREAAQQALEALEEYATHRPLPQRCPVRDVEYALRAALAQGQAEPCPNCASLEAQNTELDRKLAEMEREPQTLDAAMRLPRVMAQAYENGYKAGAAAERKRIIQFLQEMQRQVGDGHNYYGVAAMRIRERV